MLKGVWWFMILPCFVLALQAQQAPLVEVYGGYSYLRANDVFSERVNQNGWQTSVAANFTSSFGIVADFSNHYGTRSNVFSQVGMQGRGFTFLFGPRYSYRAVRRVTPFGHALFGGIHASRIVPNTFGGTGGGFCGGIECYQPANFFAMAVGGGLDVKATDRIWFRVGQVEYFRANLTHANGTSAAQNDVRFSTGIVFRFGKRE